MSSIGSAAPGPRVVTWNVASLKSLVSQLTYHYKSAAIFFQEHLRADILCVQEVKLPKSKLTADVVCVGDYESYFAFCTAKKGYSGVATFVRKQWSPVRVLDRPFDDPLLDDEGRCLVTDHGQLVVVNVYAPNAGARPERARLPYKLQFLRALRRLCDELASMGKAVLLVGDLNIAHKDIHPSLRPSEGETGYTSEEVEFMDQLLAGYEDCWRAQHPEESMVFTCWNQRKFHRPQNVGVRIDYAMLHRDWTTLLRRTERLDTKAAFSDHAAVAVELEGLEPPAPHAPPRACATRWAQFRPLTSFFMPVGRKSKAPGGAAEEPLRPDGAVPGSGGPPSSTPPSEGPVKRRERPREEGGGVGQGRAGSGEPPAKRRQS